MVMRTTGSDQLVESESPAVKKRVGYKSVAVKRRLYVCCNYSGTVIGTALKSVARKRLVKTEKT
jgi:hypothetical protein